MRLESINEFIGNSVYALTHSAGEDFNIVFQQRADVLASLTQGRQRDRKYVQAIVQVATKLVTLHHLFQVPVSRRDQPHVDVMGAATSETLKFLFLQNPQQLGLQRKWYVADFIEKKGSFIGQFEAADFLRDRSSKSASLMAKELTFEQVEGNGGTVQLDQRVAAAGTSIMDCMSDEFLASAGLSLDEHSRVRRRNPLGLF